MLKRKESSGSDDISQPNKIYKLNEIETYVNELFNVFSSPARFE